MASISTAPPSPAATEGIGEGQAPQAAFNDLRHTFGTIAVEQASIVQVQAWMGQRRRANHHEYLHDPSKASNARLLSAAFEPD